MTGNSKYRWPLLISVPVAFEGRICVSRYQRRIQGISRPGVAEIDHSWMHFPLGEGGPQLQLVALAVTLVAMVAADQVGKPIGNLLISVLALVGLS